MYLKFMYNFIIIVKKLIKISYENYEILFNFF